MSTMVNSISRGKRRLTEVPCLRSQRQEAVEPRLQSRQLALAPLLQPLSHMLLRTRAKSSPTLSAYLYKTALKSGRHKWEKKEAKTTLQWFHYSGRGGGSNNSNSKHSTLFDVTVLNQEQNLAINIQLTESHVIKESKNKAKFTLSVSSF